MLQLNSAKLITLPSMQYAFVLQLAVVLGPPGSIQLCDAKAQSCQQSLGGAPYVHHTCDKLICAWKSHLKARNSPKPMTPT